MFNNQNDISISTSSTNQYENNKTDYLTSNIYYSKTIDPNLELFYKWFNEVIDIELERINNIVQIQKNSLNNINPSTSDEINIDLYKNNIKILESYQKYLNNKKVSSNDNKITLNNSIPDQIPLIKTTSKPISDSYNANTTVTKL